MTLVGALIFFAVLCLVAYGAWWIITKFFSPPFQTIALGIVGVILLIILLTQFVPDAANYRIWK